MSFFEDMFDSGRSFMILTIGIIFTLIFLDALVTNFTGLSVATPESIDVVTSVKTQAYAGLDIGFLVLAIGLIFVSVLVSFFKSKDPIWFVGLVVGLVVSLFILVIIGAIYDRLIAISTISLVVAQLKYLPFIMAHLLEYAIIFATATSIALFTGKKQI